MHATKAQHTPGVLFDLPPYCPALQAAIIAGLSTQNELPILPTIKHVSTMSVEARDWVQANSWIQSIVTLGINRIYAQSGIALTGPAIVIKNGEQLLSMLRRFNIPLPTGMTEDEYVSDVGQYITANQIVPSCPVLIPTSKGVGSNLSLSSASFSGRDSQADLSFTSHVSLQNNIARLKFHTSELIEVNPPPTVNPELYQVGIDSGSPAIREWGRAIRPFLRNGGILHRCPLGEVYIREYHESRRGRVSEDRKHDGHIFILDNPNALRANLLALRLAHTGVRFPNHLSWVLSPLTEELASTSSRTWANVRSTPDPSTGLPILIEGVVHYNPCLMDDSPDDWLTLVNEQTPGGIGYTTVVAGNPGQEPVASVRYITQGIMNLLPIPSTPPASYELAVAIDPPGCEAADDAFSVTKLGTNQFEVVNYTVSVAAQSSINVGIIRNSVNGTSTTRYLPDRVIPMIDNPAQFSLSKHRSCPAHKHVLRVDTRGVSYKYEGLVAVRLKQCITYDDASRSSDSSVMNAIHASRMLRMHRKARPTVSWLHVPNNPLYPSFISARENEYHNAIQEISLATGINAAKTLPIRVSTTFANDTPERSIAESIALRVGGSDWRDKARDGNLPPYVLEFLRSTNIVSGGSKRFVTNFDTHAHVSDDGPYARICSPIRQLDCLVNDAFLCRKLSLSEAQSFIPLLNAGIPTERADRRLDEARRIFRPFGPCIVVQGGGNVKVLSVWRQAEISIPGIGTKSGVTVPIHPRGAHQSHVSLEIGDVIHFDGTLDADTASVDDLQFIKIAPGGLLGRIAAIGEFDRYRV